MIKAGLLQELQVIEEFFNRSSRCLREQDSVYSPDESMLTVAQHVAHVAQTTDWFIDGMSSATGFDMDFEVHWRDVKPVTSLTAARAWVEKSFQAARVHIEGLSDEELMSPLPEGPIMGGAPRLAVVSGISDHTAHHRGALTVYSRLLGLTPVMPYEEEEPKETCC